MRTTIDISDDVLFAAKELAKIQKKSLGQVLSELSRSAFAAAVAEGTNATHLPQSALSMQSPSKVSERITEYGIHPLPARGGIASNELIDVLRNREGI